MMKIEPLQRHENRADEVQSSNTREGRTSFSVRGKRGQEFSSSLGHVLILSEDSMVRDFLGQMLGLLGYDNQSYREWRTMDVEQSWRSYDAVFLESHFLSRFGDLEETGERQSHDHPMIVVLAPENGDDLPFNQESGMIRVLRKPLDYRQMGRIMDECFQLKMQQDLFQGLEDSSV
ncbi:MAG: hypothetical protein AB7P17_08510 [Nitrospirales bacterium]